MTVTIPVKITQTPDGPVLSPATPIPTNALNVACDGVNYVVTVPSGA